MILDASETIEEFDIIDEVEMDAEIWMSPDGDRIIVYRYYDDEVERDDSIHILPMNEDDFKFVFYNWIKVGDL